MKIALSGSSGLIGTRLKAYFTKKGYDILSLPRHSLQGNPATLAAMLQGADVVIHLSGAPVDRRWTKTYRRVIYDSRVLTTRTMVSAIALMETRPSVFICASAIGIYMSEGRQTEAATRIADDFFGEVCRDWEFEARQAGRYTRTLMLRLAPVLDSGGGALKKMLLPFRLGLGSKIGSGKQMFSWVHIDDMIRAVAFVIQKKSLFGPVNISSPHPVSNREFTRVLAGTLKRPAILTVPGFALRLIYGEGASMLTGGHEVAPDKLQRAGFQFRFPVLDGALKNILGK